MYLHLQNLNTNTNINANAPSSSSVTARFCWFEFIFLSSSSFCICPICGSLMALWCLWYNESHVCRANRSVCHPNLDICKAKLDIYVTSFVFSMLEHWTLNVQCSMFNLPILDVWHAWDGCSYQQGQRSRIWKWGRYVLSPRWSYFESG